MSPFHYVTMPLCYYATTHVTMSLCYHVTVFLTMLIYATVPNLTSLKSTENRVLLQNLNCNIYRLVWRELNAEIE